MAAWASVEYLADSQIGTSLARYLGQKTAFRPEPQVGRSVAGLRAEVWQVGLQIGLGSVEAR